MSWLMNRDLPTATVTLPPAAPRLPRARLVLASQDAAVQTAVRGLFGDTTQGGLAIAGSIGEAISALDQRRTDLLLLDLDLGHEEALAGLTRLRGDGRWQFLPVVILTSSREDQDLVASYSLGANSYVRKPVNFAEFIDAVRQLGLYWLLLNEMPARKPAP